ncbi:MAG: hypothetical protein LBV04_09695, partial [Deferribacteraceae bacterium]|nr:hypothetical protein [Deferribacteraceae bacterium]
MRVRISYPQTAAKGIVHIPPSKSMAHRAIICACLAHGRSVIDNISYSEDIKATIAAMQQLGVQVEAEPDRLVIDGRGFVVGAGFARSIDYVNCNESGSTLRFLIPIFSLTGASVSFTGAPRLFERPQKIYENIFKEQGLSFIQDKGIT